MQAGEGHCDTVVDHAQPVPRLRKGPTVSTSSTNEAWLTGGIAPVGTSLRLLAVDGGPGVEAILIDWISGALVATARVGTEDAGAGSLHGHRVWVQAPTPQGGVRIVEMTAEASATPGTLTLTGIAVIVDEPRRAAPRVADRRPAMLSGPALTGPAGPVRGLTVDLSRTGARLLLDSPTDLHVGDRLEIVLGADTAAPVRTPARVARLGPGSAELAVAFVDLPVDQGTRLDRQVLARVAQSAI